MSLLERSREQSSAATNRMAAEYSPFTPNGGTQQRPTAAATPLYYIGRNSKGHWVVRDKSGQSGGIFVDRVQAIKFAMFENGRHPEAVIMVPGVLELDLV